MKVVGIITEYNPFHNGHKYHIEKAKEITGADYVIAVMSGNFVQRGHPALMDKYSRSRMALNNGLDLVLELPTYYATASAEFFALGAVSLLDGLGIVDYICFGSECGDIKLLDEAARLFNNPSDKFQDLISSYLRNGLSYPMARAKAASKFLTIDGDSKDKALTNLISEPNNILGIEYIKALLRINSSIKPITISRTKAHYHDKEVNYPIVNNQSPDKNTDYTVSSATAIRNIIEDTDSLLALSPIKDSVPQNVFDYFTSNYNITCPITIKDFESIIKYKLLWESKHDLSSYQDLSPDMADRIKNIDLINTNIQDLIEKIKTKNITLTRVNRSLIHVLLDIKTDDLIGFIQDNLIYYARVLGVKKEATHLIRKIKESGKLPVITKLSKAHEQLDALGMKMLNKDILASHLFYQALYDKFGVNLQNEYKQELAII